MATICHCTSHVGLPILVDFLFVFEEAPADDNWGPMGFVGSIWFSFLSRLFCSFGNHGICANRSLLSRKHLLFKVLGEPLLTLFQLSVQAGALSAFGLLVVSIPLGHQWVPKYVTSGYFSAPFWSLRGILVWLGVDLG